MTTSSPTPFEPIPFDNRYVTLPDRFYSRQHPSPVKAPQAIRNNPALAEKLGIDSEWFGSDKAIEVFAGNLLLPGSDPIATVYSGHQFGNWNPQLGDGRAVLLGEVIATNGQRYDIQLKGAGQTPYSRMGDGLSPLGPVLREYIVSEAMAALGIPTTRSLFAVTTGERVARDYILPGAILTRVASSHIRVGHFQFFAARNDREAVKCLADHVIHRDFPSALQHENPYLSLLQEVIQRQAKLIAQWQLAGFIHGVMNTDNMLICGETIDYGPCAFMDEYDPAACFSSIDQGGRYAYQNQPAIARWNLAWFAQALLPLLTEKESEAVTIVQGALDDFIEHYQTAYTEGLLKKYGLQKNTDVTRQFTQDFLALMASEKADFTLTFRHLSDIADTTTNHHTVNYQLPQTFEPLLQQWRQLLSQEDQPLADIQQHMLATNPAIIPRNHQIEAAIQAAQQEGNLIPFQRLVDALEIPFTHQSNNDDLTQPPRPDERVLKTFCGT